MRPNSSPNNKNKNVFANIVTLSRINTDQDYLIRKETFNTFLKESDTHTQLKEDFLKSSHSYVSRGMDMNNFLKLHKVQSQNFRKKDIQNKKSHRGVMFINEIWGENHYRRVIKESQLQKKREMMDKANNMNSMEQILDLINNTYKKMKKFQNPEAEQILHKFLHMRDQRNSFAQIRRSSLVNLQSEVNKGTADGKILEDLLKKLNTYSKSEDDPGTQLKAVFGEFIDRAITSTDVKSSKSMEANKLKRKMLIDHMNETKHSRKAKEEKYSSSQILLKNAKKKPKDKLTEAINEVLTANKTSSGFVTRKDLKIEGPKFKTDELQMRRSKMNAHQRNSSEGSQVYKNPTSINRLSLYTTPEKNNEESEDSECSKESAKEDRKAPGVRESPYKRRVYYKSAHVIKQERHKENSHLVQNTDELIQYCNNFIGDSTSIKQQVQIGLKLKDITPMLIPDNIKEQLIVNDVDKFIREKKEEREKKKMVSRSIFKRRPIDYDAD